MANYNENLRPDGRRPGGLGGGDNVVHHSPLESQGLAARRRNNGVRQEIAPALPIPSEISNPTSVIENVAERMEPVLPATAPAYTEQDRQEAITEEAEKTGLPRSEAEFIVDTARTLAKRAVVELGTVLPASRNGITRDRTIIARGEGTQPTPQQLAENTLAFEREEIIRQRFQAALEQSIKEIKGKGRSNRNRVLARAKQSGVPIPRNTAASELHPEELARRRAEQQKQQEAEQRQAEMDSLFHYRMSDKTRKAIIDADLRAEEIADETKERLSALESEFTGRTQANIARIDQEKTRQEAFDAKLKKRE